MSSKAQGNVQQAYQAYIEETLQIVVNYIDGNPEVDRIWIYTDMGHQTIQSSPFFRFRGGFYNHGDLPKADPDNEYDIVALVMAGSDSDLDFVDACRAAGAVPERIITTYDPQTGELESQWDYEGVKIGEDDNYGRALDRWIRSMGGKPIYAKE